MGETCSIQRPWRSSASNIIQSAAPASRPNRKCSVAQPNARGVALHALAAWQTYKDRADTVVSTILAGSKLAKSDRAFTLELFYGVLRNLTLLDFWIGC